MDKSASHKEITVKIINPIYAIGVTWLLYGLVLPLYRFTDFAIAVALSALAYMLARRFIPVKTMLVPLTDSGALDKRCMEILSKGQAYIEELEKFKIADKTLAGNISEIIGISRQMFDYTLKNPRIALDLRNFIDYYFPTIIKFLNAYNDMVDADIKSENVEGIMAKVSSIMGTILPAFRKQLDLMYAEKRLDIKTDMEVLKTVLASEGLTDKD